MNKIVAFTVFSLLLCGCMKEDKGCTPATPASEEAKIASFAANNGISATKHFSGIFYEIINAGYGATPTNNSEITIGYVGKLLDGTIFDQNSQIKNHLSQFIEGWRIGLPLIKKGGVLKLIIPSAYAYGCNKYGNIPANSVLYFEINLIDVQ